MEERGFPRQQRMQYLAPDRMYTHLAFLRHLLRARSWTALHSPTLFRLLGTCTDNRLSISRAVDIEAERRRLLQRRTRILRTDHGAGTAYANEKQEATIGRIARHALSRPQKCRFIARLAAQQGCRHILELGTSLGVSTAYLAAACPNARVITVEGDPAVADEAREVFRRLTLDNIDLRVDTFAEFLACLPASDNFDLVFLDGHHAAEPLMTYYLAIRPFLHDRSIIIVDDIYWSRDMTRGWNSLVARPEVTRSADCFRFGLLFFSASFKEKEHHRIRLPLVMGPN